MTDERRILMAADAPESADHDPEVAIGDPGHRRQDQRRVDRDAADPEWFPVGSVHRSSRASTPSRPNEATTRE